MEMEPLYKPHGVEERWQRRGRPKASSTPIPTRPARRTSIAHPAAERDGRPAHRPRAAARARRHGHPHEADAGLQRPLPARLRPRRHLDAERRREGAAQEGTSRQELGREAFEARVWEWLHEYGGKIMVQFRRMGASLDYRRERFTMDDAYVRAVMRFFVHLYERGWIYRANRIINWCPFHETSLSDLELEHVDMDDALTDDPLSARRRRRLHRDRDRAARDDPRRRRGRGAPDDERYQAPDRREVIVPLVERTRAGDRRRARRADFGTGALKITPGHDPTDFEIGRDHGLPELTVIGPDGRVNAAAEARGPDPGRGRRARPRVAEGARPAREARELPAHRRLCERCKTRIEPRISLQWWCSMDEIKQRPLEALRNRARALPSREPALASRSTRSRTRPTGTSRGRSGGATRSRSGTARTGT